MFKEEYIQMKDKYFCMTEYGQVLKDFTYPSELYSTSQMAQNDCKLYCGSNGDCFGCYNDCKQDCRWTALKDCEDQHHSTNLSNNSLLRKPGKI